MEFVEWNGISWMEFISRNAFVTPAPCSSGSPPCARLSGHRQETGCHRPSSDPVLRVSGLSSVGVFQFPALGLERQRGEQPGSLQKKCPTVGPHWLPVMCSTCWVSGENFTRSAHFLFLLVLSAGFPPRSLFPSSVESEMLSPATQME